MRSSLCQAILRVRATRVPGFGGFFLDQDATRLNMYLLEPRTKDAAIAAIATVYGTRFFDDLGLQYPPKNLRVLQGQYDYRELVEWNNQIMNVLSLPDVGSKDIDESRNRLVIGLEREEARSRVEEALENGVFHATLWTSR